MSAENLWSGEVLMPSGMSTKVKIDRLPSDVIFTYLLIDGKWEVTPDAVERCRALEAALLSKI